jgi:hypothetical protein
MRTFVFVLSGFLLWAASLGIAKFLYGGLAGQMRVASLVFVAAWFLVAAINLGVGVLKAGYTVAEEMPIFLLIFGLPAAVAFIVNWRFL